MTTESWLAAFTPIGEGDFRIEQASSFARFVRRHGASIAKFVEGRRKDAEELVILEFVTGAPQRSVYPLRHVERIAVRFPSEHAQPAVMMLRDDFPDTEHQQLVPEGMPAAICIDDRPWAEARLIWTPAELVNRIHMWFYRAGRGELHDARQPIDPIFIGSNLRFFISRESIQQGPRRHLIGLRDRADPTYLRVRPGTLAPVSRDDQAIVVFPYSVRPEAMKRLKHNPTNLGSLAAMLSERGIDLLADLRDAIRSWILDGDRGAAYLLNSRLVVITEMPVVSPRQELRDGLDHRAYFATVAPGEIGATLGVLERAPGLSQLGYVQSLAAPPAEIDLSQFTVQTVEVHLEFEPDLAARISGRKERDRRKAVLVGAGAIGSHLADYLAREGRFEWTVIDDDQLLPHNLARHIALKDQVARRKATVTADHLNAIVEGGRIAIPIDANLFTADDSQERIVQALDQSAIIIDATASIVAARDLSDRSSPARRVSAFFNPSGEAAVILVEQADRSLTLRDLEAQYYGLLIRTPELEQHLGKEFETVAYTGACRALTNRMSQSRAAVLSGVAAMGISNAIDREVPAVNVWSLATSGAITVFSPQPEPVIRWRAGEWEVTIDRGLQARIIAMRSAKLPDETGGVLFGLVDIPDKRIHLIYASPAPPDSIESPSGFIRGMQGVEQDLDRVFRVTAGQVRYVGEWHSHPPRYSACPSTTDDRQLDWLATLMDLDALPALMVIAAEREMALIFADQQAERIDGAGPH
jgi:integrative and conjugative element protein (TIGR02256 family)